MGPGVGSDLMTLCIRPLDGSGMGRSDVNLALVDVVAGDKEGSLSVIGLEDVKNVIRVILDRAIVVCDGNVAFPDTFVDALSAIENGPNLGAGHG